MAKKPSVPEEVDKPEAPVSGDSIYGDKTEGDSLGEATEAFTGDVSIHRIATKRLMHETIEKLAELGSPLSTDSVAFDKFFSELEKEETEEKEFTPSFTTGLYAEGEKKKGFVHNFLAALGLVDY